MFILVGQFPLSDLLWYKEKKTLGESYLDQCLKYSSFVGDLVDNMYTNTQLSDNINKMRDTIIINNHTEPSVVSGTTWFDNMTSFIDILKHVQDKLGNRIIQVSFCKTRR